MYMFLSLVLTFAVGCQPILTISVNLLTNDKHWFEYAALCN